MIRGEVRWCDLPGSGDRPVVILTRDTVIRLAPEAAGTPVVERTIDRTELYACEEAFWCGSGQEIVPILSVDRLPVGDGRVGPITRVLQERYFSVVRGEAGAGHREWLTPVWKG